MSAQTQLYLYNQRQPVVLLLSTGNNLIRRYEAVYSKTLTISRGVANVLEFQFINTEEKPIQLLPPNNFVFRILSYNDSTILFEKALDSVLPLTGIFKVSLTADDTNQIDPQQCYYSIEHVNGANQPTFVGANGGSRGVLQVVDSIFPRTIQSTELTIPTHPTTYNESPKTYYSSELENKQSGLVTMIAYFENFTGNIELQGSNIADFGTLYTIGSVKTYNNMSGTDLWLDVRGYHPFVRAKITNKGTQLTNDMTLGGELVKILAR
jgi:hypothetical protein